jgi:hypothetical protein
MQNFEKHAGEAINTISSFFIALIIRPRNSHHRDIVSIGRTFQYHVFRQGGSYTLVIRHNEHTSC